MSKAKDRHQSKTRKKKFTSFNLYIYKVLKSISNDIGISKKGMTVINSLVQDMFDQFALEASRLVRSSKKSTLNQNDVEAALKLLLPSELAKHAISEGRKAVKKFNSRG